MHNNNDDDDDDDDDNNNNNNNNNNKHMGYQVTDKYYEHIPEKVIYIKGTTIMWDIPIITDWTIQANQPDIVMHDKQQTCLLTDIPIQGDLSITSNETEKLSKYKDLEIKVSRCGKWGQNLRQL